MLDRISRRSFLTLSGLGCAHLGVSSLGLTHRLWARPGSSTAAEAPWARVERLDEGIWAVVSTPLETDDWTTGCNGGIVAGKDRVLVVESFVRPEGAKWVAETARELTGTWPTDVVITHFHGDHSRGLEGLDSGTDSPTLHVTSKTLELIRENDPSPSEARAKMLEAARLIDAEAAEEIDLGEASIRIRPLAGHTPSDVTVDSSNVVFGGDLLWNERIPNYRDAIPSLLGPAVRTTLDHGEGVYVPGHGPLADRGSLDVYVELLDSIGAAATRAFEQGVELSTAAAAFEVPEGLSHWKTFNERYFEVAFRAWYRELEAR